MTGINASNQISEIKVLWEYIVRAEYLDQFMQAYAPGGAWSSLFKKYPGYRGTELIQDSSKPNRFVTIDHWVSLSAYSNMKHRSRKAYKTIDVQCEIFTVDENYIGVFEILNVNRQP